MNKINILSIVLISTLLLAGCTSTMEKQQQPQTYTNISVDELYQLQQEQDILLIDTHIPEQEHILGTDKFIPYNEIAQYVQSLPKDKPLVLYCRSGSMSQQASEELAKQGFDNIFNVVGGTNAWRTEGYTFGPLLTTKTTGSTGMGDVSIALTPYPFENGQLKVELSANTHSVDLSSFDLMQLVTLSIGDEKIKPSNAPTLSGHHSSGTLLFETGESNQGTFSITIENISAVSQREYVWS